MQNFLITICVFMLVGCGYSERKLMKEAELDARDQKRDQFIEYVDGSVKVYNQLKYKEHLIGPGQWFEADGQKMEVKRDQIKRFQTANYCAWILPEGLAFKLASGKIDLFVVEVQKRVGNESFRDRAFLVRKGVDGKVYEVNKPILKILMADKKQVQEEVNEKFTSAYFLRNLLDLINDYNQAR